MPGLAELQYSTPLKNEVQQVLQLQLQLYAKNDTWHETISYIDIRPRLSFYAVFINCQ